MRNKGLVLLAGVALLLLAPMPSLASTCPAIGFADDCNLLITFTDGSVTLSFPDASNPNDPSNAYDSNLGGEDQLVGVQNNTSQSIGTLKLKGSGIFGFDGDGAATLSCDQGLGSPNGCPFSPSGSSANLGQFGPTGYEGPGTSFSGISADLSSGNVDFKGGIAPGGSAWFSLEESASTVGTAVAVGTTPEPGTMILLGTGMAAALARYRRRRKV